MPPTINSVWELTLKAHVGNQIHLNIWHYALLGDYIPTFDPAAATQDLARNWYLNVFPLISPAFHSTWRLDQVIAKSISGVTFESVSDTYTPIYEDQYVFNVPTGEGAGERIGAATPSFVCVGYQKLTNRPGRSYRGSFRISPILEEDTVNNALTPTAIALFDDNEEAFLTHVLDEVDPHANGFYACVWSPKQTYLHPNVMGEQVPKAYSALITGLKLNPLVTSQVSRKERPLQ